MSTGNIGRSSAQKNQMITFLDNWSVYYPTYRNNMMVLFGWDKEKDFSIPKKRIAIYESLLRRKNRKDYATHEELTEGFGLGA